MFPEVAASEFLEHYIPINREYWERYQRHEISQEELRYGRLRTSFGRLNHFPETEVLEKASARYIELLPDNNYLHDNALDILEYLKPKYNLHIITNGFSGVQQKKLENSGIASYFLSVTDSEKAGYRKPDSRIYDFALSQANALRNQSVMIGDCLEADVDGALACGIQAFWYGPGHESGPEKAIHIQDLSEIKNYL